MNVSASTSGVIWDLPIHTRDGHKARFLGKIKDDTFPMVCAKEYTVMHGSDPQIEEDVETYSRDGRSTTAFESDDDIFNDFRVIALVSSEAYPEISAFPTLFTSPEEAQQYLWTNNPSLSLRGIISIGSKEVS